MKSEIECPKGTQFSFNIGETKYMVATNNSYIEIRKLTQTFYNDYPHIQYPEILHDVLRPYSIALFTFVDYYVGVPFRTYMKHNNGFLFSAKPIPHSRPGLDYTKIVVFDKNEYVGQLANIDNNQQSEFIQNIATISQEIDDYIQVYINHCKGINVLHPRAFQRKYGYSTLKYFHDILGI